MIKEGNPARQGGEKEKIEGLLPQPGNNGIMTAVRTHHFHEKVYAAACHSSPELHP
jgi:hypothetical protein